MASDKFEVTDSKKEPIPFLRVLEIFRQANGYLDGIEGLLQNRPLLTGMVIAYATDIKKDTNKAIELYRSLAEEEEYPPAQLRLGYCYKYGRGVRKNATLAYFWFMKAASQGLPSALFAVGDCYECGHGVAMNRKMAMHWYEKAAMQGDIAAEEALQVLHGKEDAPVERGDTKETKAKPPVIDQEKLDQLVQRFAIALRDLLKKDATTQLAGRKLCEKLAIEGYVRAQFRMGECCEQGLGGIEKNMWEAMLWYEMAAEQGYGPAQLKMGQCYKNGYRGLNQADKAGIWLQMAKRQGCKNTEEIKTATKDNIRKPLSEEEVNLILIEAERYLYGKGVPHDLRRAVQLYQRLAEENIGAALFMLGYCNQQGWGVEQNNFKAVILYRMAAIKGDQNTKNSAAEALWTLEGHLITTSPIFERMQTALTEDVIFVGETHPESRELGLGIFTPARRAVMELINLGKVHKLSVELGNPEGTVFIDAEGRVAYNRINELRQIIDKNNNSFTTHVKKFFKLPPGDQVESSLEQSLICLEDMFRPLLYRTATTSGTVELKQTQGLQDRKEKIRKLLIDFAILEATAIDAWEDVLVTASKNHVAICFHDSPLDKTYPPKLIKNFEKVGWRQKIATWQESQVDSQATIVGVGKRNKFSVDFLKKHKLLNPRVLVMGGSDHFRNFPKSNSTEFVSKALHTHCNKSEAHYFDLDNKKLIFGPPIEIPITELETAIEKALVQLGVGDSTAAATTVPSEEAGDRKKC